jgi:hypothetical protein
MVRSRPLPADYPALTDTAGAPGNLAQIESILRLAS